MCELFIYLQKYVYLYTTYSLHPSITCTAHFGRGIEQRREDFPFKKGGKFFFYVRAEDCRSHPLLPFEGRRLVVVHQVAPFHQLAWWRDVPIVIVAIVVVERMTLRKRQRMLQQTAWERRQCWRWLKNLGLRLLWLGYVASTKRYLYGFADE